MNRTNTDLITSRLSGKPKPGVYDYMWDDNSDCSNMHENLRHIPLLGPYESLKTFEFLVVLLDIMPASLKPDSMRCLPWLNNLSSKRMNTTHTKSVEWFEQQIPSWMKRNFMRM